MDRDRLDFRAERKDLCSPTTDFTVVEVPEFDFLMVDGHGDPNTSAEYADAVEALYGLSFTAKFASKQTLDLDYVVAPLEGLWDSARMESFIERSKDEWSWTMMIRQPTWLTPELWDAARTKLAKKQLPALGRVRLESFAEGTSVQVLHVGSYDDEAPTIATMHEWIAANGYQETGRHHEIYIGDPRRTPPERLKTILRQPVSARAAPEL